MEKKFASKFVSGLRAISADGGPAERAMAAYLVAIKVAIQSPYAADFVRCLRIAFANGWRVVRAGVVAFREAGGTQAREEMTSLLTEQVEPSDEDLKAAEEWRESLNLGRFVEQTLKAKADFLKFREFVSEPTAPIPVTEDSIDSTTAS